MRPFAAPAANFIAATLVMGVVCLPGCKEADQGSGTPPPAKVIQVPDMSLVTLDKGEVGKFPLIAAERVELPSELSATGSIFPDVAREVPVISMANGRVVDTKARLDDNVKKGQLLFQVQSPDIASVFNTYVKAVSDEEMTKKADLRAQDLYQHGAISQAMVEQADAAERDAKADVVAAEDQLRIYGVDKAHPSSVVNVYAPISGVIIGQNVTNSAAAGVTLSGSATAFTIADLSTVWVLCDVYENDLPKIKLGQEATVKVNGYPDRLLMGRIGDIGPVLDPQLRTAKVRIQMSNPGFLKLGMFVTATFTSRTIETHPVVPAQAVLHLHDRDWVFVPATSSQFRRTEVHTGNMISGNRQVILSGLHPGERVVGDALLLETAGSQ